MNCRISRMFRVPWVSMAFSVFGHELAAQETVPVRFDPGASGTIVSGTGQGFNVVVGIEGRRFQERSPQDQERP